MAEINPFKALIYNPEISPVLDNLIAPPYDVISPSEQDQYYLQSPYNIIRLILGKDESGDNESSNRYTRAAAYLGDWLGEGILKRLDSDGIYVYGFDFEHNGEARRVLGFVALVRLSDFDEGVVLPHEKTFAGPKADRLRLMQATSANLDQIYSTYSDDSGVADTVLKRAATGAPLLSVINDEVAHHIWTVTDRGDIDALKAALSDRTLFIADGHHRYETALNYARWRRDQGGTGGGYDYVPMLLVDAAHENPAILPTHRVLIEMKNIGVDDFLSGLEKFFLVKRVADVDNLLSEMGAAGDDHAIGLHLGEGKDYLLTLADKESPDKYFPEEASADWKNLDAAILQFLIFEAVLGIKDQNKGDLSQIKFVENPADAASSVNRGDAAATFFLNPTKMDQVQAIAGNGEKMPQKSTYFYPKPVTGLIMNLID